MTAAPVAKGFKPHRRLYRLDFAGTDLDGLEIAARGSSMAELLEVLEGADGIGDLKELDESRDAAKIAARLREMVAPFARKLVSWNLLDDGDEPVPASLDGLLSQDLDFVVAVITAYGKAMTQAPPPLPAGSASGGISPEESAMMAGLSSSLPSSPEPRLLSACATAGTSCRRRCWPRTRRCCGCSTCTGWGTAARTRREVRSRCPTTTSPSASARWTRRARSWTS